MSDQYQNFSFKDASANINSSNSNFSRTVLNNSKDSIYENGKNVISDKRIPNQKSRLRESGSLAQKLDAKQNQLRNSSPDINPRANQSNSDHIKLPSSQNKNLNIGATPQITDRSQS